MGARQSKRSVDITTTPKKDGLPSEGGVAGDAAAPGDGKLERIEESDGSKPTTNGTTPHADVVSDEKDKDKEQEKDKEKEKDEDTEKVAVKVEDTRPETNAEAPPSEAEEVTTPTEGDTPASPETATSPEGKDAKKKDKKKWSFRSLSFGKRDRSKKTREDAPKNGDVTKEEPLAEGGEEAEAAVPVEESTFVEKTAVSSPAVESTPAPVAVKEEEKAAPASPTPVEEKKEEPTPAPTPVPVEEKKEEIEKIEHVVAEKVEVSPVQAISPVGVTQAQPIATPSIIERKTSEDLPPALPSSPPPTPIDPSPLQQAQHAAANASALAEALKVPAEAASMASQIAKEPVELAQSIDEPETKVVAECNFIAPKVLSESVPVAETKTETEPTPAVADEPESVTVPVKECEVVCEIAKSVESVPEIIPSPAESQFVQEISNTDDSIDDKVDNLSQSVEKVVEDSLETGAQKIVENGVSELDSASSENLCSLAKGVPGEETIESVIARKESEVRVDELVIQSEEGPLPLSEESLVEAKPALVIPEDDLPKSVGPEAADESSETVDVLSADKVSLHESDADTALPDERLVELEKLETNYPADQTQSEPMVSSKTDSVEDVVPPLPESPIPSLQKAEGIGELLSETIDDSFDLINELKNGPSISQNGNDILGHLDSEIDFDPIEKLRASHLAEGLGSPGKDSLQELSSSVTEILNISISSPPIEKIASPANDSLPDFPSCPVPAKDISNLLDDLPVPPNDLYNASEEILSCPFPAKELSSLSNDITDPMICPLNNKLANEFDETLVENGSLVKESSTIIDAMSPKILSDTNVSADRNPSPVNLLVSPKESSQLELIDDLSNQEFGVESLSQSLNSYNNSDVQLKERLAESEGLNGVENAPSCPLLKAVPTAVPENAQKIEEPETVAENPAEVSTTESLTEAPASPAPPVPVEVPILPPSEPAITEDVASVTKAIEENDISDKAVAAAVNEAIESVNTNEIVTDSLHQKVINE